MDQAQIDELVKALNELRDEVRALRTAQQLHTYPVYVYPPNTTTQPFEITCGTNVPSTFTMPPYKASAP